MIIKYMGSKPYIILYKNEKTVLKKGETVDLPRSVVKRMGYRKLNKYFKVIDE